MQGSTLSLPISTHRLSTLLAILSRIMCTIGGLGRHIGRQSTDISVDYRSTIGRQSTDYRLIVDRLSTDSQPMVNRYIDRLLADM